MNRLVLTATALLSIVAFSASAYPPPEKNDMELNEILMNQINLTGKIIETRISYIEDIRQQKGGGYRAQVWLDVGYTTMHSAWVNFPADAKDFIDELATKSWGSSKTELYILVKKGGTLEAVGEKYKKSKGTYSW